MTQKKLSHLPLPIAEDRRRELIVRFLAELMQITGNPKKQNDFQAALQAYCDSLHPWLDPVTVHLIHRPSLRSWKIALLMKQARIFRWCYPQKRKRCFGHGYDAIKFGVAQG